MKLYRYQQEAVRFAQSRKYSYLAIPCGGGKTFTALEATKDAELIVIICPASLCNLWADEIIKAYDISEDEICVPTKCSSDFLPKFKYLIVSYDKAISAYMYPRIYALNYTCIIVDEAHKIKNPIAKRTKALLGWQGKKPRLLTKPGIEKCILLSGTPMMQRPWELYSILRGLIPDQLGPYTDSRMFGIYFCKAYKDVYGRWIRTGADHMDELARLTKDLILHIRKEQVDKDLPPLRKQIVRLSCAQTYLKEEKKYDVSSLVNSGASLSFEGLSELRHMMAIQKIPYIQDFVSELLSAGEKVIIFAWHRKVIASTFTYLEHSLMQHSSPGQSVLLLDGSVPASERQALSKEFNENDSYRCAVCQLSAVSEGISLHSATHVVFAEISWNPSDNHQALKRVHRKGQTSPVLAHYLVVKNSLDDKILKNVLTKEVVVSKFDSELLLTKEDQHV